MHVRNYQELPLIRTLCMVPANMTTPEMKTPLLIRSRKSYLKHVHVVEVSLYTHPTNLQIGNSFLFVSIQFINPCLLFLDHGRQLYHKSCGLLLLLDSCHCCLSTGLNLSNHLLRLVKKNFKSAIFCSKRTLESVMDKNCHLSSKCTLANVMYMYIITRSCNERLIFYSHSQT